jgi:carbohydrate diacid regulator
MDYCITDVEGKEVASTARIHLNEAAIVNFAHSPADTQEVQGAQYFKVYDDKQLEYVLIVIGTGEISHVAGKMAAFQMQNLVVAYKERFDKDNFIKNLLLDNLLLVDIYGRAKKLHIAIGAPRVVLVLEATKGIDSDLLEVVRERCSNYIGGGHNDFVTAVDEKNVIIVAELEENSTTSNVEAAASALLEHLHKLGLHGLRIACGTIVQEIKEVSRSYKEAKMALDVGRIFFENRNVVAYSELGIGRLIYQLPLPLCKMFIEEIFDDISPDDFDEETLTTINKFFENSLNVSETSRQLFIHRNTLVYRLDKLQRSTGLDLRVFEDAITFRIALMVVKYMKYMETSEY